jgi:acetate kinase
VEGLNASSGRTGPIAVFNAGSSSLKFGLYEGAGKLLTEGEAEEIGSSHAVFWFCDSKNKQGTDIPDHASAFRSAQEALHASVRDEPVAVAHRFVHGGPKLTRHALLNEQMLKDLNDAVAFAPLHLPSALAVLKASKTAWPNAPQVVCFDTAFHTSMPDVSRTLALPKDVREWGLQRFGFHGLSLESILAQLEDIPEKLVIAHLGNGSSITAILSGRSVDTTMGFTPNAGVLMGTRCGDIDPGAVLYIMEHGHETPAQLDQLLNKRSGLLGVSGLSSDVRELSGARRNNRDADLALRMFAYQVRKAIGSMAAALGGLDLLVFTGGIGEHSEEVRADIESGLKHLGGFQSRVMPAKEDWQMARIAEGLIRQT